MLACGSKQFLLEYSGCQVVNPGVFSEGQFAVYVPSKKTVEFSECTLE